MKMLWAICRLFCLVIWLLLWVLALPFILLWGVIRLAFTRAVFRSQLYKHGIPRENAIKMARQYTIGFHDITEFIKKKKYAK